MNARNRWWRVAVTGMLTAAALISNPTFVLGHEEGTLKLVERSLVLGRTIDIAGVKFAHDNKIRLELVGVKGRIILGDVEADSTGAFTRAFSIPTDLAPGAYRLVAVASDGDEITSLDVEVLTAETPANDRTEPALEAEPTDEPMTLDRAPRPWVTGGALAAILAAFVIGGTMLRRPEHPSA